MHKTIRLLLVTIFAVALMAPPAYPQNTNERLNTLQSDVLNLSNTVKSMQTSADEKNKEMKALLEQILARFSTIDSSVHSLGGTLGSIKTADEKSARDIENAKADLTKIKESLDSFQKLNLSETLNNIDLKLGGLKRQVDDLQNTPTTTGPTAREVFNAAYLEVQQGFNDLAIGDLKDFLNTYPKDSRAPSAQLLIGNAYVAKKDYAQAVIAYDETIQKYPESEVKCTALYKKGLTLVELKQATEAKQILQSVQKDCPDVSSLATGALSDLARKPAPARGGRGQ